VDEETCVYLKNTGRPHGQVEAVRSYYKAQQMFGNYTDDRIEYSTVLDLNLEDIEPSVAGPKRPQDRIPLSKLKQTFRQLLQAPGNQGGYGKSPSELETQYPVSLGRAAERLASGNGLQSGKTVPAGKGAVSPKNTNTWTETEMVNNRPTPNALDLSTNRFSEGTATLRHASIGIASITSCTNTSNPSVMIAAGLLAKKAVELGIAPQPFVKTSLAPGSRVVSEYLEQTGLQQYLDQIGFNLVGYGCATCIGNSGPLDPAIEDVVAKNDLILSSVLSGNRNFEARVHQSIKANFLMSPPLVVAFALAGRVDIDLTEEPLGRNARGQDVYLKDVWPTLKEIGELMQSAFDAETYRKMYADFATRNPLWNEIPAGAGAIYDWDESSTYIQEPPYFDHFSMQIGPAAEIKAARPLAIFGDSITTDHISPAGSIKPASPAGLYLQEKGVEVKDFNSYGARRGNHQVMVRGTFANVRIKNLMVPGIEGGVTIHYPSGKQMSIYEAAGLYEDSGTPLLIFAGQEYGTGSSRDWAAKGTRLLGVRAVIAQSYERIHRSNLVGMGVLPCQFREGVSVQSLSLMGNETFDLDGLGGNLKPRQECTLTIHRANGKTDTIPLILRIDTPIEVDYYRHGGILSYVLRQLLA
jgi:aconitate hydratase